MEDNITPQVNRPEQIVSICVRNGCIGTALRGSGDYPYCSKSCRNKIDYQKNKEQIRALNAIRSQIKIQDDLLAELYRKWGAKPFTMSDLQTEGFIDGDYSRRVLHHQSKKQAQVFLYYALLFDPTNNTYQIIPTNEL
ncbi:MAG: hypothetical protein P9M03_11955 [Candidatus Theseobacter exili]|nr:hypothetical protein [Candidatus Theseobacter exili]